MNWRDFQSTARWRRDPGCPEMGCVLWSFYGAFHLSKFVLIQSWYVPQAVFPAFFALYVSKERRSSVQAMQMSNGLSDPIGLWLGHLMFDSVFSVIFATITVIIWAAVSNQFRGLGFFVSHRGSWPQNIDWICAPSGLSSFYMELLGLYLLTVSPFLWRPHWPRLRP
jgi:hypothetical protein